MRIESVFTILIGSSAIEHRMTCTQLSEDNLLPLLLILRRRIITIAIILHDIAKLISEAICYLRDSCGTRLNTIVHVHHLATSSHQESHGISLSLRIFSFLIGREHIRPIYLGAISKLRWILVIVQNLSQGGSDTSCDTLLAIHRWCGIIIRCLLPPSGRQHSRNLSLAALRYLITTRPCEVVIAPVAYLIAIIVVSISSEPNLTFILIAIKFRIAAGSIERDVVLGAHIDRIIAILVRRNTRNRDFLGVCIHRETDAIALLTKWRLNGITAIIVSHEGGWIADTRSRGCISTASAPRLRLSTLESQLDRC